MINLFHIQIKKISFCHNSSVKVNNLPNVILTLTWQPEYGGHPQKVKTVCGKVVVPKINKEDKKV